MLNNTIKNLILSIILSSLILPPAYTQTIPLTPEYLGLLQDKINAYFIYPTEAKAKRWEGIVKVKFTINRDGRIKNIDIAESSGYPLLDAAAILAVRDASPYPFPEDGEEKEREIILPINFAEAGMFSSLSTEEKPAAIPPAASPKEAVTKKEEPAAAQPVITKEVPTPKLAEMKTPIYNGPELTKEDPVVVKAKSQTSPEELSYFMDLALRNNQPTKVALEEVEFAQLKVTEAQRNLFPALKLQAYNTDGEVFKVAYTEREAKVQVDQPIFYGGRLKDTLRQAKVNLEITQKNYDRLKLDVIQKAETAYYNVVAARMNLKEKEALAEEAQDMLTKIEKLLAVGMLIPVEASSAQSWFEQLKFQIDSIKQDLFMAELTLKQVLSVKETPKIEAQLIDAKRLNLNLEHCLELAYQYRPEITLSELLVKFNDYGQRVEKEKNNGLTVDLSASYGSYQGAFTTEPMRSSDNWYAGVKVSKPWGANTLNSSYAEDHSRPRIGQTSPTESKTLSGEFNLLDNIRRMADKKRSDIDLHRSMSDFDETLKTITFEVQDAFLNYQKAVLQLNTSEKELSFRRSQTEVIKVRALAGETNLSSAMEALYSLAETQTRYIQALANYQISLANLKKATGYGLRL